MIAKIMKSSNLSCFISKIFLQKRLKQEGLQPAKEADKEILLHRIMAKKWR